MLLACLRMLVHRLRMAAQALSTACRSKRQAYRQRVGDEDSIVFALSFLGNPLFSVHFFTSMSKLTRL